MLINASQIKAIHSTDISLFNHIKHVKYPPVDKIKNENVEQCIWTLHQLKTLP